MGKNSAIPWTHHTFNPWWGCTQISLGCEHCYAKALAKRFGHDVWGNKPRRFFDGGAHWREPEKWNKAAEKASERHRVFCGSMCDVFEDRAELVDARARLFTLIYETPCLDWLLLTKRPANFIRFWPLLHQAHSQESEPLPNVWLGITAENQATADERIPILLNTPVVVRFVSIEPILGPIDLAFWSWTQKALVGSRFWVICGDESGPRRRPARLLWIRNIRDQCQAAGIPFFFKQSHETGRKIECPELDGRQWTEFPRKGATT